MSFDVTSTLLATGSSDTTIKLWDIERQYCTHNLRGHQGVIRYIVMIQFAACKNSNIINLLGRINIVSFRNNFRLRLLDAYFGNKAGQ